MLSVAKATANCSPTFYVITRIAIIDINCVVFVGRSFGQERPPLTDLLKNILLRYPDGGQILKVSDEMLYYQGRNYRVFAGGGVFANLPCQISSCPVVSKG